MEPDVSLATLLEQRVGRDGDEPLVHDAAGTWSGHEFLEECAKLADHFRQRGMEPGDRVLVLSENRAEVLIAYSAAWRAGLIAVPMTPGSRPRDCARVVGWTQPTLAIADSSGVAALTAAGYPPDQIVRLDPEADGTTYGDALQSGNPHAAATPADGDAIAALLFTGGTTGRAKGVPLSHRNLWSAGYSRMRLWSEEPAARSLLPLPLSHVYGLMVHVCDLHWPGARSQVLMPRFSVDDFVRLVPEFDIEETTLVPAAMEALLRSDTDPTALRTVRYVASGSAPLARATLDGFVERYPWIDLRVGYGMTEASGLITGTPRGSLRPGSVGRSVPDCDVRIVDESGQALGAGQRGEIQCRSPFVMSGYWPVEGETDPLVVVDGWLQTGDVGELDDGGFLTITGRTKDVINRGGFNVYPGDVEAVLLECPGVAAAVVVGAPDEVLGEEVVAFYVSGAGAQVDTDTLDAFAAERMAGYRRPHRYELVDSLPRTALGKIDRNALRAMATRASERAPGLGATS
jgi:long-chain acyl-CoA synthetase